MIKDEGGGRRASYALSYKATESLETPAVRIGEAGSFSSQTQILIKLLPNKQFNPVRVVDSKDLHECCVKNMNQ